MDETLKDLERLLDESGASARTIREILRKFGRELERVLQDPARLAELAREVVAQCDERAGSIDQLIEKARAQVTRLAEQASGEEPEPVGADSLARQFAGIIESIQRHALETEAGAAVVLKTLDVEVKGLVTVKDDRTGLVLPTLRRTVDPGQLSTLRLSFGAIPIVQSAEPPVE